MDELWPSIARAVMREFSDVPDVAQATRIVVRLTMAALLGGLLGWERAHAGKAAGIRTHMLVAMGSALFVLVAQQGGIGPGDNSRVMQGVIAGIGFLGAGTILKGNAEGQVRGLTTAAGIWMTAAIGIAAGLGQEATAVLCTALALAVLWLIPSSQDIQPGGEDVERVAEGAGAKRRQASRTGGDAGSTGIDGVDRPPAV
ncbi:MgtC/SapB family protein [Acidovorax sp. RAC01]|uniref:MgtC/SapB family protein n=1 Tax=Acidovorax sp. RAC01 TaxID=1842533 RepID=UPI00083E9201|nr:MgtC/SapB family protein [Acidovorax sp. RAC01]AOG21833.1 mgtC family protein [Acidovorax sp. RAC01]